jgi:hypothetical protein
MGAGAGPILNLRPRFRIARKSSIIYA